jgi:cell wall-associated NlpC family hydrolase
MTACVSSGPTTVASPPPTVVTRQPAALPANDRVAAIAERQLGVRYRYGGSTPSSGFDCSGLVHYSFSQAGLAVPRTSREQFRAARKIALSDARPGDIVFFQDQEKLSHVGIYLGGDRFVHAPSSGKTVSIAHIDTPYYQQHLVAVGRLH